MHGQQWCLLPSLAALSPLCISLFFSLITFLLPRLLLISSLLFFHRLSAPTVFSPNPFFFTFSINPFPSFLPTRSPPPLFLSLFLLIISSSPFLFIHSFFDRFLSSCFLFLSFLLLPSDFLFQTSLLFPFFFSSFITSFPFLYILSFLYLFLSRLLLFPSSFLLPYIFIFFTSLIIPFVPFHHSPRPYLLLSRFHLSILSYSFPPFYLVPFLSVFTNLFHLVSFPPSFILFHYFFFSSISSPFSPLSCPYVPPCVPIPSSLPSDLLESLLLPLSLFLPLFHLVSFPSSSSPLHHRSLPTTSSTPSPFALYSSAPSL